MKSALVIGSAGQDGQLLTAQLVSSGWGVVGVDRDGVTQSQPLWSASGALDLTDRAAVDACIETVRPDATFYLAAFHQSSEEVTGTDHATLFHLSHEVHVTGWLHVLDALLRVHPSGRAFYAASSHVFGEPDVAIQDESTPFRPLSPYAITKVTGVELARHYRRLGVHASVGILYNHESLLRAGKFVSQRIVRGAVAARHASLAHQPFHLELGNLNAVVDWSWAEDVTRAMRLIVEHSPPDDYVVASGIPHTIADFCRVAFDALGLDFRQFVTERPGRLARTVAPLVGNSSKLRAATGWKPTKSFEEMVRHLVEVCSVSHPSVPER